MAKRKGVREIIIKSDTVECDGCSYEYTLTVRESSRVASYRIPLYSVSVRMFDGEGKETFGEANDAFSDVGKALVFYEKLVEHLATPLNLPYILEDEYCT